MASEPSEAWGIYALVPMDALRSIADDMDDYGMCPYFRRGEPGQDPAGTCSFDCDSEPACQTCWEAPGWPSERLRLILRAVTEGQEGQQPGTRAT